MKIILPGGTGQIGRFLVREFTRLGHTCVVLTRGPAAAQADLARRGLAGAARAVGWDARTPGPWTVELEGADAVINLAGRSVNCRYTEANLATMLCSRVDSTRVVGEAIAAAQSPPRVWLQASTATIYAHAAPADPPRDESGPLGGVEPGVPALWKRSVDIGLVWEHALFAAPASPPDNATAPGRRTRRVALRTAMVMGPGRGGVFDAFASLCRLGMGRQGGGAQWVSWIHEYDLLGALRFLLARDDIEGVVNLAAPAPLPNAEFIAAIHDALGRRLSLPAPAWLLEVGAIFHRTETELLLKSRRVVPARLLDAGYRFHFPDWPAAARDLIARWRHHDYVHANRRQV